MFSYVKRNYTSAKQRTRFDDKNDGDTRIVAFPLASSSSFFFPSSPRSSWTTLTRVPRRLAPARLRLRTPSPPARRLPLCAARRCPRAKVPSALLYLASECCVPLPLASSRVARGSRSRVARVPHSFESSSSSSQRDGTFPRENGEETKKISMSPPKTSPYHQSEKWRENHQTTE